jgi:hypothetical protein
VVRDTSRVHKSVRVREPLEAAGASVLFLSGYSPIEAAFSKIKSIVFKIEARPHEAPVGAIGRTLGSINRETR